MFQVVELQGEYEAWWFFDDWKEQIKQIKTFESFDKALDEYQQAVAILQIEYPEYRTKKKYLSSFWNENQNRYCPECEDDIQIFHSVMLLEEYQVIE
ncbi:DUF1033 family protein [Carnobacterium sp.]|uniref:DUF1033 family protein n=1 Tax=Carnobacterium sp. TaxID=48221 RepID=UPI003C7679CB